jgi:ribosomal protein L12E/L44/L45/RPP1/RPP2
VLQEVSIDEIYEELSTSEAAVSQAAAEAAVTSKPSPAFGQVKTKGTVRQHTHGMT